MKPGMARHRFVIALGTAALLVGAGVAAGGAAQAAPASPATSASHGASPHGARWT